MANTFTSDLSGNTYPNSEKVSAKTVNHHILNLIYKDNPNFKHNSVLSAGELKVYRKKHLTEILSKKNNKLTKVNQEVIDSISEDTLLSEKMEEEEKNQPITYGQKIADNVAKFGGSWTFIISFGAFLALWIFSNVVFLLNKGFDPYPFILLNLILSCIAAIQAPIIMMSQNRTEDKDRKRAKNDYMINLKSELEIRNLNEKLDHFINSQQQELTDLKSELENILKSKDTEK